MGPALCRGSKEPRAGGIASPRSAVLGATSVWRIEGLNMSLGTQHLYGARGRAPSRHRAVRYREPNVANLYRKNNLLFAVMSYRVNVVKPRHAIKSADKHRLHPSMQLMVCAPAIRCWSHR